MSPKQERPPKSCERCGGKYEPHRVSWQKQRFCSGKCARAAQGVVPAEERFWKHVDKTGSCWVWTAGKDRDGYGHIALTRNSGIRAHRFAWQLANGRPVPDGMVVLHSCDNPSCVKAEHLSVGTNRDNIDDMVAKGRSLHGESNLRSKLKPEHIPVIRSRRENGEYLKSIAADYGVLPATIWSIVKGKTWKRVG